MQQMVFHTDTNITATYTACIALAAIDVIPNYNTAEYKTNC